MALVAGLLALSLGLGGCSSDDPKPKIAPPETTAPTVSQSPTADPASAHGEAAFIEVYFETVGHATTSGNPASFLRMSGDDCDNCRTLAMNIRAAFADGGTVEGGDWTVTDATRVSKNDLGTVWNVEVDTPRERWFNAEGDLVKVVRPSSQHFGVVVSPDSEDPVLVDLRLRS